KRRRRTGGRPRRPPGTMYALQCKHFVDPVVLRTLNGATHQMPTPVGHSLAGLAVHLTGRPLDRRNTHALLGLVALANAPDLDLVPGYLIGNPGAYHWGPTHSFAAAILAGTLVGFLARRYGFRFAPAFTLATAAWASHVVLDMLLGPGARGSVGLQAFWPLSTERFMAPVGVFRMFPAVVHEVGPVRALFTRDVVPLILREIAVLLPVCLLIASRRFLAGRRASRN